MGYLIVIYAIIIYILIMVQIGVFSVTHAPLAFGFFFLVDFADRVGVPFEIENHPYLSFFLYLAVFEILIYFLMSIPQISRSVIMLSCCLLIGALFAAECERRLEPDSVAYCIGVSALYGLVTLFVVWGNIYKYDKLNSIAIGNLASDIVSGIFYGLGLAGLIWYNAQSLWKQYCTSIGVEWSPIQKCVNIVCLIIIVAVTVFVVIRGFSLADGRRQARITREAQWRQEKEIRQNQPRHL